MDTRAATLYAHPLLMVLNDTVPTERPELLLQSPLLVAAMAALAQGMTIEEFMVEAQAMYYEVFIHTEN